jgi:hypothetical protein
VSIAAPAQCAHAHNSKDHTSECHCVTFKLDVGNSNQVFLLSSWMLVTATKFFTFKLDVGNSNQVFYFQAGCW